MNKLIEALEIVFPLIASVLITYVIFLLAVQYGN